MPQAVRVICAKGETRLRARLRDFAIEICANRASRTASSAGRNKPRRLKSLSVRAMELSSVWLAAICDLTGSFSC